MKKELVFSTGELKKGATKPKKATESVTTMTNQYRDTLALVIKKAIQENA